jgi:hypothetical protein
MPGRGLLLYPGPDKDQFGKGNDYPQIEASRGLSRGLVAAEGPGPIPIRKLAGFSGVGEPGLMHHGNRLILIPDLKAQAGFHQTPEKAAVGRFEQINEMEGSAGPQHAVHFTKRCLFLLARNKAEHACAAHAVKGGVGIGKLVRKTPIEVDLNASSLGFASRPGKRLRIGIESDDGDARMILLDQHGLGAGAATEVEDAMAGRERHLVSKRPADGIAP